MEIVIKIGYTLRVGGARSPINDRRNWDGYIVDGKIRRLTVDEGKEMMGFPAYFKFPVNSSQAMKQLGNSVAVKPVKLTAKKDNKLSKRFKISINFSWKVFV